MSLSRTQNRCFYASATAHGVLLLAVVIGSAFFRPPELPQDEHLPLPLQMIPVPGRSSGGGNPKVTEAPAPAPPAPAPAPAPSRPKVEETPAPPAPVSKPAPIDKPPVKNAEIPLPIRETRNSKAVETPHPDSKPKKNDKTAEKKIAIADTSKTIKRTNEKSKEKPTNTEDTDRQARQYAAARRAQMNRINQVANAFSESLSTGVSVSTESPGTGGPAFRNYGDIIVGVYESAWIKPTDVQDDNIVVQISVTIARDGHVVNARVTGPSGVRSLDKSVRQTLDRVREFPAFPEGMNGAERTFEMNFRLRTSQNTG